MKNENGAKRVLVTGANRGIGRETAIELARRGAQVVLGARNSQSADDLVKSIRDAGGSVDVLTLDVSDSASVANAAREFTDRFDRLDVLINNAAIFLDKPNPSVLSLTRQRLMATFQTNTFGALEVAQSFLPALRRAGQGRVINLSSGYGQLEGLSNDASAYCLSKLALNGVTILLAAALKAEGIAVNSVCPGWVRTDMGGPNATRSVEQGADTPVWLALEADQSLTGRFFRDRKEIPW